MRDEIGHLTNLVLCSYVNAIVQKIVNTKCIEGKDYEFIDDKTKDHIGDVQKLLFICEQVSVHFLVEELHTERGVEGQVSRYDMECIVKDF